MDKTLDLVFALDAHGDHVSAVSHRDDIFLQMLGIRACGNIVLKRLLDAIIGHTDLAANIRKRRARLIGNDILGNDGAINFIFQLFIRQ